MRECFRIKIKKIENKIRFYKETKDRKRKSQGSLSRLKKSARHTLLAYAKFRDVSFGLLERKYHIAPDSLLIDKILADTIQEADELVVYILLPENLPKIQYAVQSAHVMAEFVQKNSYPEVLSWIKHHKTLILLKYESIDTNAIGRHHIFKDDDTTTILVGPITRKKGRELFGRLPLCTI